MSTASRLFSLRLRPIRNSGEPFHVEFDRPRDHPVVDDHHTNHSRRNCHDSFSRVANRNSIGQARVAQLEHVTSSSNTSVAESSKNTQRGREISNSSTRRNREFSNIRISGTRYNRNDRLPGAVVRAKERLLERLRGTPLPTNRRTTIDVVSWDEFSPIDSIGTHSGGLDSDTSLDWFEVGSSQVEYFQQSTLSFQNGARKPPGIELNAVNRLQREVYKDEMSDMVLSVVCSICLEKFSDGDELILLSCNHRFHPTCLIPWIETRADCPNCRAAIT